MPYLDYTKQNASLLPARDVSGITNMANQVIANNDGNCFHARFVDTDTIETSVFKLTYNGRVRVYTWRDFGNDKYYRTGMQLRNSSDVYNQFEDYDNTLCSLNTTQAVSDFFWVPSRYGYMEPFYITLGIMSFVIIAIAAYRLILHPFWRPRT